MIPARTYQVEGSMSFVTIRSLRAGVVANLDTLTETALRWIQVSSSRRLPTLMRWRRMRPCYLSFSVRIESSQEKLLEAQAHLEQQDARVPAAGFTSTAPPRAQMAAPPPPRAPLINDGAQPAEYIYVGLNQGQSVWAHADIIQTSVGGSQPGGQ
jgi:hypothetical protein